MKAFGLVLVSLFAAAAAGMGQERRERRSYYANKKLCPSCFPPLDQRPPEKDTDPVDVVTPTSPAVKQRPQVQRETGGSSLRRQPCPGCYSAILEQRPLQKVEHLYNPDTYETVTRISPVLEQNPQVQEAPKRNVRSLEEIILPRQEPSLQVQRETVHSAHAWWPWPCPGCFSVINGVPQEKEQLPGNPEASETAIFFSSLLERNLQEAPKRNVRSLEEIIRPRREPSLQVKGETVRSTRRWRPCPGCYSVIHRLHPPKNRNISEGVTRNLPALEKDPQVQEAPKRNVRSVEEIILPRQEPSLQVQRETVHSARRPPPCTRCYSVINGAPQREAELSSNPDILQALKHPLEEEQLFTNPEDSETPTFLSSLLEQYLKTQKVTGRTKRFVRAAPPARARGKQRSGARAVCRGCYSGLMIVAPPAQGSRNETWVGSQSESEGDSSEEVLRRH